MPKTLDEIKKGLECCAASYADCHKECPYKPDCDGSQILKDALVLIQQLQAENAEKDQRIRKLESSRSFAADLADGLKAATVKQEQEIYVLVERNRQLEAQNAELLEKVEQLQAERDAAVCELDVVAEKVEQVDAYIDDYIHAHVDYSTYLDARDMVDSIVNWEYESEWRGVQKEDSDDGKE